MKRALLVFLALACLPGFLSCGGGGGDGAAAPPVSSTGVQGVAVKGPLSGAEIKLFYFDSSGNEIELPAANTPVLTSADGSFDFKVDPAAFTTITSPLVVLTTGGQMGTPPVQAPVLGGVIADPALLTYTGYTVTCNLSTASSVAAGLLRKNAASQGQAPSVSEARSWEALVEDQLHVDLSRKPDDPFQGTAMLNRTVDQNLDLLDTPSNVQAVNEYIEYLVANLSSSTGVLDGVMDSPSNPGTDTTAVFASFGAGGLDSIIPGGPAGFLDMRLSSDADFIENNGTSTAILSATLNDAAGAPVSDVDLLYFDIVSGSGTLSSRVNEGWRGHTRIQLTSSTTGDITIEAGYRLDNGNLLTQKVVVSCVDLVIDSDGDGFPDGLETLGYDIVVDSVGYGYANNGALLETRHVFSEPDETDTDGDGLDDYTEYLIRTDPNSWDTDGDGLTDQEEWYRWLTNPNSVDSDGDARGPDGDLTPNATLFDGAELSTYRTSPTLDDTDGDGKTDFEESDHPSRSPLVADLPRLDVRIVDEVDVRLDVEYAEETGTSYEYGTELSRSQTKTTSVYNSHTVGASLTLGVTSKAGFFSGGVETKTEFTISTEHTVAFTNESSKTAQESYSEYSTDSRTRTETAASGSMSMGIQLENTGNITYSITQLGFTVRQWVPTASSGSTGSFRTIATLTPTLGGGITLAPGSTSPVLQVEATDINATRIKEFLAKPDSLYLEPASYELENAEGLNFAYLEEITGPQTARILIDFGDGTTEEYRVATNVNRDWNGAFEGITMREVMADILFIPYTTRPRRSIDPGATTNEEILDSVRDLQTQPNPGLGFWMAVMESEIQQPTGVDFDSIVLHGGDTLMLIYVLDSDGDGLYAPEEQHYRTRDDGSDQDLDGLTDVFEVRDGWDVAVVGRSVYHVFSDPVTADQDGDGLDDSDEYIIGTDPTIPDTDKDGIGDGPDLFPLHPARVLRVKTGTRATEDGVSWDTAYSSLTNALLEAASGNATLLTPDDDVSEIWLASGTYMPDAADRDVSFELVDNVGVYGGFTGTTGENTRSQRNSDPLTNGTVLSGDLGGDDTPTNGGSTANSDSVVHAGLEVTANAVLDGFTITGGANQSSTKYGSGLSTLGLPTLRNLHFFRNYEGSGYRPALGMATNITGEITLENCLFSQNRGGGIYVESSAVEDKALSLHLIDCDFQENERQNDGAAISTWRVRITLDGCNFIGNTAFSYGPVDWWDGGGALHLQITDALIRNCRFIRNEARGTYMRGGAIFATYSSFVQIAQSIFWGNWADLGGAGIAIRSLAGPSNNYNHDFRTELYVVNSTVTANSLPAGTAGAGIQSEGAYNQVYLWNTIVYGNLITGDGNVNQFNDQINFYTTTVPQSLVADNSCFPEYWVWGSGSLVGKGNTDQDPKFTNSTAGNLTLKSGSPALDAGANFVDFEPLTSGYQQAPEADIGGNWRTVDGNGDGLAIIDMGAYEYQAN